MNYEEMGFSKEEGEFLESYPRLFTLASTLGIRKDYLDNIFSKMNKSLWLQTQTDHESKQTYLYSMLVRLNHFEKSLNLLNYKNMNSEELIELFGKRNAKFAFELLKLL